MRFRSCVFASKRQRSSLHGWACGPLAQHPLPDVARRCCSSFTLVLLSVHLVLLQPGAPHRRVLFKPVRRRAFGASFPCSQSEASHERERKASKARVSLIRYAHFRCSSQVKVDTWTRCRLVLDRLDPSAHSPHHHRTAVPNRGVLRFGLARTQAGVWARTAGSSGVVRAHAVVVVVVGSVMAITGTMALARQPRVLNLAVPGAGQGDLRPHPPLARLVVVEVSCQAGQTGCCRRPNARS